MFEGSHSSSFARPSQRFEQVESLEDRQWRLLMEQARVRLAQEEVEWKQLAEFLFSRAMEHDSANLLFRLACEYLISVRVIRPGVINVLERVATARDRARVETWSRVEHLLPPRR